MRHPEIQRLASSPILWTLTSVSLAVALNAGHLPAWVLGAFVLLTLWRVLIGLRSSPLPPRVLRYAAVGILLVAVLLTYRTLNGVDAGTALLTLMAALKLLETRARRDHLVLLLIALFLVLAAVLYEQQLAFLPLDAAVVWVIATAMLRVTNADTAMRPRALFAVSGRLLLQALPLMAIMFLLFPRVPGPFWSLPSSERAVTGLGDEMSPGDISELSVSSDVAFRVRFDGAAPPPVQRYWRGPVLHDFDGYTWRRLRGVFHRIVPVEVEGPAYEYSLMLEASHRHWIFALDMPEAWPEGEAFRSYDYQLIAPDPLDQAMTLRIRSRTAYRTNGQELPTTLLRRDTRLPSDRNPRTRELAATMRAAAVDDAAYIRAVLHMFREQEFSYTLTPPKLDLDSVDDFLFNTRRGFCGHYASAFTTLMRAAGIPARVVTGYQGGELNRFAGYYIVRQSDAHAWSEVWLKGRGWVRIDPTAAVAPERIERGVLDALGADALLADRLLHEHAWLANIRFAWDAANTFWRERIVEYGASAQQQLLESLGIEQPDWQTLTLLLTAGITLALSILALQLARELRVRSTEPVQRAYEKFCRRLARRGLLRQPYEGPLDFATRVRRARPDLAPASDAIARSYVDLRYGTAHAATLEDFIRAVRHFRAPPKVAY